MNKNGALITVKILENPQLAPNTEANRPLDSSDSVPHKKTKVNSS